MKKKVRKPIAGHFRTELKKYEKVALVLQGGGALGSYQAGVYEGMAKHSILPNWVAGISIGALNCAIIAGNSPENRVDALKGFWEKICKPGGSIMPFDPVFSMVSESITEQSRQFQSVIAAWQALLSGQNGFFLPRSPLPIPFISNPKPDELSYYRTNLLRETLLEFADFDLINQGDVRVSVGAVNVRSGNFTYFDNSEIELGPEHFMASGALPPGFPAVLIDGEYYWDGGMVSNTPLAYVLEKRSSEDTLAFQVDLWSAQGPLPQNFLDIVERGKEIQFSSKTRAITDLLIDHLHHSQVIDELLKLIPQELQDGNEWVAKAKSMSYLGKVNIIHLIYSDKSYEGHYKDFEFSTLTMRDHWQSGLEDMHHTFKHPEWIELPDEDHAYVTHDIHRKSDGGDVIRKKVVRKKEDSQE